MRKFITLCLLFIGLTATFGQDSKEQTLVDKTKEVLTEYVDVDATLSKINDIEGLFVHYFKEATEGSKELVGSTIEVAEKTITLLFEQSTIIVKQFIIYTSISYAIPILIGALLLFWLPKKITNKFAINTSDAKTHNLSVDADKGDYVGKKKLLSSGRYYNSRLTVAIDNLATYLSYGVGVYIIAINIMPFIKVTFFSKLYLVELLLKYV
jgi:hypothetical protein